MWAILPMNMPPEPVTGFCCLPRSATMPRIISPIFFSSPPQASSIWVKDAESMLREITSQTISLE